MNRWSRRLLAAFAVAGIVTEPLAAAVHVVDVTRDSVDIAPGDGTCADAFAGCSLRAAVQESNAMPGADRIELGPATYLFTIAGLGDELAASGDLDLVGELEIVGVGTDLSVIDAGALDRVFDLRPAAATSSVRLRKLTLRNGAALISAGVQVPTSAGIRVAAGVALDLVDVVIRDNVMTSFNGGAAIDNAGCIHGERVRILDNGDPASPGSARPLSGGIAVRGEDACLHLVDSEISGNRGDQSGAVYLRDQPVVTIRRSLIAGNQARFAGAIEISDAQTVLLENTTISGNRGNPGAILNDGFALLTLVHCTVTGNGPAHSIAVVGGIQDVHGGFGRTFLSNTVIAGNGPGFQTDDCDRATSVGGGNLIGDAGCHFSAQPGDRIGVPAALGVLADNGGFTRTHAPGVGLIDEAAAATCPPTDQRGEARPVDGDGDGIARCDSGAVEADSDDLFGDGFDPA